MQRESATSIFLVLLFAANVAIAFDAFEIQVYDSEIDESGKGGIELHLNQVFSGRTESLYAGETPPNHLTHITFEPSYGLTRFWELGGYLQFARVPGEAVVFAGVKLRSKFVVPKQKSVPVGLGVNVELSRIPTRFESGSWGSEIRPIATYEWARWYFAINPILTWSWSESTVPAFEPASKIRWDTGLGFGAGIEYFAGMGEIDAMPALRNQEHVLYVAWDLLNAPLELNVGVGYGLTSGSNGWAGKMIAGTSL